MGVKKCNSQDIFLRDLPPSAPSYGGGSRKSSASAGAGSGAMRAWGDSRGSQMDRSRSPPGRGGSYGKGGGKSYMEEALERAFQDGLAKGGGRKGGASVSYKSFGGRDKARKGKGKGEKKGGRGGGGKGKGGKGKENDNPKTSAELDDDLSAYFGIKPEKAKEGKKDEAALDMELDAYMKRDKGSSEKADEKKEPEKPAEAEDKTEPAPKASEAEKEPETETKAA